MITQRETMRRNPPDILLTNYKMLDYLLLRGRDKPLWEKNDPESLRFLVVDEMHTFDGAQGADLALLLRRLKHRLRSPKGHLICVGSSATLGAGEDAKVDLRRYAETIFGEPFDEGAVATETRKTPNEVFGDPEYVDRPDPAEIHTALREAEEMDQADAALRLATALFPDRTDPDLAFIDDGAASDQAWRITLGERLKEHHLCQRVLKIIAEHKGPASLEAIAAGLAQVYTSAQNEEEPEAKPRFLMFSDSVQDAAHRAAVAETRNSLSVYQKSLFTALQEAETDGMSLSDVIEKTPAAQLDLHGPDAFTALYIPKEQTWRGRYQELIRDGTSITDTVFLNHMKLRLGWEYFVDLSYRSHFSHTLEANGMVAADVSADVLSASAQRLASELRNDLPGAPDIDPALLARFLFGVVQRMRRQGSVAHPYVASAVATASGARGLNWFASAIQMGVGRTGTLPIPDSRRGLAPIPVTLGHPPLGYERITRSQGVSWYRDWLFRTLGVADLRYGTDPDTIYPMVLQRLEADSILRRVNGPDGQNRQAVQAYRLRDGGFLARVRTHLVQLRWRVRQFQRFRVFPLFRQREGQRHLAPQCGRDLGDVAGQFNSGRQRPAAMLVLPFFLESSHGVRPDYLHSE